MTAESSGATDDYSTRPRPGRARRERAAARATSPLALRVAAGLLGLAGVVLLVVSTWATVVQIKVLTTSDLVSQDTSISGGDLHGIALVLVAAFALLMLAGAVRGARPAMLALAATGLLALGLVIGLDVPELDNTGQVAQFYEDVSAGAAAGFYYETLGAVLLLLTGGGLWVLTAEPVAERLGHVGRRASAGARVLGSSAASGVSRARTAGSERLRARRSRADDAEADPAEAPADPR